MTAHTATLGNRSAAVHLGRWEDVLADVEAVDTVICDPPYGARTHAGHASVVKQAGDRQGIAYQPWSFVGVAAFVAAWAPRCRGWMVAMTSHDLVPAWRAAYEAAGRYAFAPVWVTQNSVRLVGDGPASPGVYVMVSRPRTQAFARWGALPGHYSTTRGAVLSGLDKAYPGGKSIALMRRLVADYSRPGELVCDPCAGVGTTLAAALLTGRDSVGAEVDRETWEAAGRVLVEAARQQVLL